jgi:hypothetical protein
MSTVVELVEGWTDPLVFNLLKAGTTPSGTMVGMTCSLVLRDNRGNLVNTSGDVAITDSTNWVVTYSPDATDLVEGAYRGRFAVTDGSGATAYFPSAAWDVWLIRSVA